MIHKHQHFDLLDKVIIEHVIFTPPLRVFDKMEDEACLLYAVNGKSTIYGSNQSHHLHKNQGVFMKCGNYFNKWHSNHSTDEKNEAVAVHLYPEVIKHIYKGDIPPFLTAKKSTNPSYFQSLKNESIIKNYIDGLLFYFENPELVDDYLVTLKVKELLNMLYKLNSNGIQDIMHDMFNPHEAEFKTIINAHLFDDLSVEDISKLANLSLSSFKRKFKEVYNTSPASYIKKKRLEKASKLLITTNNRISDVCFDCGFNNIDSFSRAFKNHFNVSPYEYRNQSVS